MIVMDWLLAGALALAATRIPDERTAWRTVRAVAVLWLAVAVLAGCAGPGCTDPMQHSSFQWCNGPLLRAPDNLDVLGIAGIVAGALIGGAMRP